MAIIIPGYPGVPCNPKWYGASNVCPNKRLWFSVSETAGRTARHRVGFLGTYGDMLTHGATCAATPTYFTRSFQAWFVDIWAAYRAGAWTSSVVLTQEYVGSLDTIPNDLQCAIEDDYSTLWHSTFVAGVGGVVTCASGFSVTKTITVYDDGSYTVS